MQSFLIYNQKIDLLVSIFSANLLMYTSSSAACHVKEITYKFKVIFKFDKKLRWVQIKFKQMLSEQVLIRLYIHTNTERIQIICRYNIRSCSMTCPVSY